MTSDSQLQSDVLSELRWEPSVNAAHIGVAVNGNVVTLTGQVDYYMEKMAAEQAAKRVYGVQAVVNNIEVELPDSSRRTDQDIAAAATNALEWDAWVPEGIKATVDDGWVTLEGSVDWQYQKDAAERCVRNLTGVAGVTNSIGIKSKATPSGRTRSRTRSVAALTWMRAESASMPTTAR